MRALVVLFICLVACTPSSVRAPSPLRSATVAATAAPTPSVGASRASGTFAAVCGTVSNYVADGTQNGSLVLSAPGREPLKLTIPAGRLGGGGVGAGSYACVGVLAGVPSPLFDGFATSGTPGFLNPGKTLKFRQQNPPAIKQKPPAPKVQSPAPKPRVAKPRVIKPRIQNNANKK